MRVGITALIASNKEMETVAKAGSGEEAIALHALHLPDITLMDLRLPGISGVETIRSIRNQSPKAPVYCAHHLRGRRRHLSSHGGGSCRLPG
jgi:DNA-binding NarL/FixJ family response regulator